MLDIKAFDNEEHLFKGIPPFVSTKQVRPSFLTSVKREVKIGGELYSDSLGDKAHNSETYIKTVKANADTIVNALK